MVRQRVFLSFIAACALVQSAAIPSAGQATSSATNQAASASVNPVIPKDANAAMRLAARVNGLDSPDMKPWHLKAIYQTYDAVGKAKEMGIFEEWWAGPEKYRISYEGQGFSQVLYRNGEQSRITGDSGWAPLPQLMAEKLTVHPLPAANVIAGQSYAKVDARLGRVTLGCLAAPVQVGVGDQWMPTVCLANELPIVRVEVLHQDLRVLFNKYVQLGGHYVAEQIEVANGMLPIVKVDVTTLESLSRIDDEKFLAPASAMPAPVQEDEPGVKLPVKFSGGTPIYPDLGSMYHPDALVILGLNVKSNGEPSDVRVVSSPAGFQKPAVDLVKTWRFTPAMFKGQPVEIRTQVYIAYHSTLP